MMDKAYSLVIKSMERMRKETEGAQIRSEGESGPLSLLSPPPPPPVQTSVNPLLGMWWLLRAAASA